jgi:hypothetical protein
MTVNITGKAEKKSGCAWQDGGISVQVVFVIRVDEADFAPELQAIFALLDAMADEGRPVRLGLRQHRQWLRKK